MGRAAGVSEGAIARVEGGGDGDDWSLRQVRALARALAVTMAALTDEREPAERSDDVGAIGALLARGDRMIPTSTLAHALGWELARVNRALRELSEVLPNSGQRLQRLRGRVAIRPGESTIGSAELRARANRW